MFLRLLYFSGRPLYILFYYFIYSVGLVANTTGQSVEFVGRLILKHTKNLKNKALVVQLREKKTRKRKMKVSTGLSWIFFIVLFLQLSTFLYSFLKSLEKWTDSIDTTFTNYTKQIEKNVHTKIALLKKHTATTRQHIHAPNIKIARLGIKMPRLIFAFTFRIRYLIAFCITCVGSSVFLFWFFIMKDLPDPHTLANRPIEVSTKIYDRNGELLYNIYKDKNRSLVTLDKIPIQVKLATLAIEDAHFYSHSGFSVKGIARAFITNIEEGKITGGSTITQQLVKNALLSSEKTVIRKLRELVLSIQVEQVYSKDEILEMYLNEVSYGGTAYGIQEASRMYFEKDADQLTLAEAALLAGLPKSPTTYSPFGTHPQRSLTRQKDVLRLMEVNEFITHEQRLEAQHEVIVFSNHKANIKAPHFVMYVRKELEESYGQTVVEQGGLEVITSLDYRIQQLAEEVVSQEIENLKTLNVTNAGVVVMNPKTGEILAMVGSKNYFDIENDGNVNVTTSLRQPGSSIKLVNYAYALSHLYNPATIIDDSPTSFIIQGQPTYTPKNYEGGFRGKISLRSAFAESRNIPAVKVLSSYGVNNMIELGKAMGVITWTNPANYGLSLTLGGGEVRLIDLARVYATVANYGKRPDLVSLLTLKNHEGKLLEEFTCKTRSIPLQIAGPVKVANASVISSGNPDFDEVDCPGKPVLDPGVAFLITNILSDNSARSPAFGANSLLNIPNHPEVAVKTGTSNDLKDNLAVGYNQDYVVAVWVGNNDSTPMSRIASGVTGATPIFSKIMTALLADTPQKPWGVPENVVRLPVCSTTGTLTCSGCPSTREEWFIKDNTPKLACSENWFAQNNPGQPQGRLLPEAVRTQNLN